MSEDYRVEGQPPRWNAPVARRRRGATAILPWVIGAFVVLALAVAAGLGTAYLVSVFRAAPPPRTALPPSTPTPAAVRTAPPTVQPTAAGSVAPTDAPPPTDEPSPSAVAGATPRVHVVERGEYLSLIAEQYGVTPESIIELNELDNPNLIVPGQELLIPPP